MAQKPKQNRVTRDITTPIATLSFPRLFEKTKGVNDKGEDTYDVQILIPKSDKKGVRALMAALTEVGEANYGEDWKSFRLPIRDGDKEKNLPTDDGTKRGEKYPERLGHYFINARSPQPIGVFDRALNLITNPSEIYAGVKAKVSLTFYPYNSNGNVGIGAGLNGVQKIADGEAIGGGGKPSVESMFDVEDEIDEDEDGFGYEDDEDEVEEAPAPKRRARRKPAPEPVDEDEDDEDDDEEEAPAPKRRTRRKPAPAPIEDDEDDDEEEAPAPKRRARKAAAPAKKAAASRRKPKPAPVEVDDEDDDLYEDDDFEDLDDEDI